MTKMLCLGCGQPVDLRVPEGAYKPADVWHLECLDAWEAAGATVDDAGYRRLADELRRSRVYGV